MLNLQHLSEPLVITAEQDSLAAEVRTYATKLKQNVAQKGQALQVSE
ncbi:hypothetical protein [Paenibacillus sp. QZ-Y1]